MSRPTEASFADAIKIATMFNETTFKKLNVIYIFFGYSLGKI